MTDDIKAIRDALAHIAAANRGEGSHGLRSARDNLSAVCHPGRMARLLDALEQASKDAERYRWMRGCDTELLVFSRGADLDAAIDAAMSDAPGA